MFGQFVSLKCQLQTRAIVLFVGLILLSPWGAQSGVSNTGDIVQIAAASDKRVTKSKRKKKSKSKARDRGQDAVVQTESAIVYSDANFDAPTMAYLKAGKKVRISNKIYGSYFRFYKIRLEKKKYGYISTIDVNTGKEAEDAPIQDEKVGVTPWEDSGGGIDVRKPFMAERYVGLLGGLFKYQEKIPGIPAQDTLLMYGLKLTGPDLLFMGPSMDINLAFHYGAPEYYNRLSQSKPTGFMIVTDILLLFPFLEAQDWAAYLGAGPMILFSNYQLQALNSTVDVTETSLGGSFMGGLGFRVGSVGIRLEGKYILEQNNQYLFQAAVQHRF